MMKCGCRGQAGYVCGSNRRWDKTKRCEQSPTRPGTREMLISHMTSASTFSLRTNQIRHVPDNQENTEEASSKISLDTWHKQAKLYLINIFIQILYVSMLSSLLLLVTTFHSP